MRSVYTSFAFRNRHAAQAAGIVTAGRLWTKREIAWLVAAHVVLGPVLKLTTILAALYAVSLGLYCLYLVFQKPQLERLVPAMGYVAGAEVLIRMTKAPVFWMYSEYLILLIAVTIIIRVKPTQLALFSPLLYVLLLMPSTLPVLALGDFDEAHKLLAFNLLGPVALGIGVFAASRVKVSRRVIENALLAAVFPVLAVAGIILLGYVGGRVEYLAVTSSNKAAAGGFGPNQVSNILSLAASCLFALILAGTKYQGSRKLFVLLLVATSAFALMTLSRGGVYNALGFVAGMVPSFMKTRKQRTRVFVLLGAVYLLYIEVLIPELDTYSKGALTRRYEEHGTSQRDRLVDEELKAFMDSPIIGQGPGMAVKYRVLDLYGSGEGVNTHTEYTRLLAEHGLFGLAAMLALLFLFLRLFQRARPGPDRGFVTGAIVWILIFFGHSATRIVAFAFLAILATFLSNVVEDQTADDPAQQSP